MKKQLLSPFLALVLALVLAGSRTLPALAHERVSVGPYVLVVGWASEPSIVGERNALVLEVSKDGEPVAGVEASLDAELLYAGRTFRSNLAPSLTPGQYTVEFVPTVRGQYSVRLFGAIGDTPVDETVEPEEVSSGEQLQFPETQPSLRELQRDTQAQLEALDAGVRTARTLALAGTAFGLAGLAVAVISLRRSQRNDHS